MSLVIIGEDFQKEVDKIKTMDQLSYMIETYQNLVFSVCLKMTNDYFIAEDLTQETFLSAFKNLDQFDGQHEKAWLCRIATNKCLDYQKQKERCVIPSDEVLLESKESKEGLPERDYIEKETEERLEKACESLKPPYDEIAKLYYVEEKRAEEIAVLTGRNIKTVQTQVYRARAMLRKIFGKERGT